MYISKYEIAKNITDYQIELLIYLELGFNIVNNEGANFKVWLEKDGNEIPGMKIRKDSCNKLLSLGLMELVDNSSSMRYYYYKNSLKGESILNMIKPNRLDAIKNRAKNKFN